MTIPVLALPDPLKIQPSLLTTSYAEVRSAGAGTFVSIGGSNTATTSSSVIQSGSSFVTSMPLTSLATTATAGTIGHVYMAGPAVLRGSSAGVGGFNFSAVFTPDTLVATSQFFVGLRDTSSNPTAINWLTSTTPGRIGLAISANTGNWQLVHCLSGSTPTTVDLGSGFAVATTKLLRLQLSCAPNASGIAYSVRSYNSSGVIDATASGTVSSNLPAQATLLRMLASANNGATASITRLAVAYMGFTIGEQL